MIDVSPLRRPAGKSASGYLGVYRQRRASTIWAAKLKFGGRQHHLGTAPTPRAAAEIVAAELLRRYGPDWPSHFTAHPRDPRRRRGAP